jgi:hypothetical protein
MLLSLLIIALAFSWLLKETDYLRIRLPVGELCKNGDCCPWRMSDDAVDHEMKAELVRRWRNLPKEVKVKFEQGLESPLCGWGYAWQFRDYAPEMYVELDTYGVRYKMTLKDPEIIKAVVKANKVTKAQRKAYLEA